MTGKLCLHIPLLTDKTETLPLPEELFKRLAIKFIGPSLQVVFTIYLYGKAKIFMKGYCPHKKMSSIGRYKRNLMSHVETTILAIMWNLLGMWEVSVHFQYSNYNISPANAFKTENMLWLILGEGTIFMFTVVLSFRDIPTNEQTPKQTQFYVHIPGPLEPRRPLSLHGNIIGPLTATYKSSMNGLSISSINTICVPKYMHHKQTKLPPITLVRELQSSDEMEHADEISSGGGDHSQEIQLRHYSQPFPKLISETKAIVHT